MSIGNNMLLSSSAFNNKTQIQKDNFNVVQTLRQAYEKIQKELKLEKDINYNLAKENTELKVKIDEYEIKLKDYNKKTKKTKNKEETSPVEFSEYKTDGKRKARAAEPIRSYDDFFTIQKYFLSKNNIRDWALWTIGVSLGLRISDLLALKIKEILNEDYSFKTRIKLIEKKTSKANNCLITESVKYAATKYFDSIGWKFSFDDYLFTSKKTKTKMREEYGWKIISDAGKALGLPLVIGSHTMRKSFANIAACVDKSTIDMNSITKIQGLLNHSDQRVTMKYLGTYQDMYDNARRAVSDFVMGKTNINQLIAGNNYTLDDIVHKLDLIDNKI